MKCSHGATIGQLDDDAIFYLRARGIDEAGARRLLIYAFANELIERVAVEPLRAAARGRRSPSGCPAVVGALPMSRAA